MWFLSLQLFILGLVHLTITVVVVVCVAVLVVDVVVVVDHFVVILIVL